MWQGAPKQRSVYWIYKVRKNPTPELREVIVGSIANHNKELYVGDASLLLYGPSNCVWLSFEIKQNHRSIMKKSCIAYQFMADVETYGHHPDTQTTTTQQRLTCALKKMPGCCLIVAAASAIRAVKSSSGSTGDVYIGALMWLHRKKPIGVRTGALGGQATGPPRPVQRSLKWQWDDCSKEDLISLTTESAVTIKQQPGIFESTRQSLSAVYRGRWPYVRASALNCYAKQL